MRTLLASIIAARAITITGQQLPDTTFAPVFHDPVYAWGQGPVIAVDEAHHNFHTRDGRYQACARALQADGFRVTVNDRAFSAEALLQVDMLVIANALNTVNEQRWSLPTPSAFTEEEIRALHGWVEAGGGLLLIADHMPFAGAAAELASAFGFTFSNGFALDTARRPIERFFAGRGLVAHPLTAGVDTIVTFTGSAFRIPENAAPIIALGGGYTVLEPTTAWEFDANTPALSGEGWYQGASATVGRGRLVIFGEAAMFSAQLAGAGLQPVGMNMPEARDNIQLLRNIARWLTERGSGQGPR